LDRRLHGPKLAHTLSQLCPVHLLLPFLVAIDLFKHHLKHGTVNLWRYVSPCHRHPLALTTAPQEAELKKQLHRVHIEC
jgi:hypothetical protein